MFRKMMALAVVLLFSLAASGCMVKESTYLKKEAEATQYAKDLAGQRQSNQDLSKENTGLKGRVQTLTGERDELDRVLRAKSDDLSKTIADLRQKNTVLETDKARLTDDLAQLKKKETTVQAESETYRQLMQEMKAEVAKGQITINEFKGKLTVDVANQILFASGEAEVNREGLDILKRVVDILKGVKDKAIRVEGHTDNKKIFGRLAKTYPTNWELSAARAINVVRYLEQQGIDPLILSAAAYGEFKPVADNGTEAGQAQNRRIAIILLPKD